ncbi:hypothetical protein ACX93W_04465 [Paenibacillus sp. CAU 1782]
MDKYLTNLIVNDKDLQELEYFYSEQNRMLAKVRLDNKLKADISSHPSIDSLFVFSVNGQDYIEVYKDYESIQERMSISDYVQTTIQELIETEGTTDSQWEVKQIDNTYYLLRILQTKDAYVGAWANIVAG